MKIKFLSDQIYETEGRNTGPKFSAGQVVDLSDDMANRWLRRQVAVIVTEEPENEKAKEPEKRQSATDVGGDHAKDIATKSKAEDSKDVTDKTGDDKPTVGKDKVTVPTIVKPVLKTGKP